MHTRMEVFSTWVRTNTLGETLLSLAKSGKNKYQINRHDPMLGEDANFNLSVKRDN